MEKDIDKIQIKSLATEVTEKIFRQDGQDKKHLQPWIGMDKKAKNLATENTEVTEKEKIIFSANVRMYMSDNRKGY
ncbi:MAG: hypothetical protein V3V59_00785 [Thermodesulfovibrionales bacterium]